MKHKVFILFAVIFFATQMVQAQTEMLWDSYGLGFTLPKGMRITQNDGEVFSAERQELFLTIHPLTSEYVTEDDLVEAVIAMAEEMDYDDISDADALQLDDLLGVYIEGTTSGVPSFVIALMDTESDQNYIVIVVFSTEYREEAIEMVHSFYPYDER